jgi:RNA polymerase sigma-70 factor (ECF subfamily)
MPERTDEDLLVAAGTGEREAFGILVERHHRGVVRFAYRFLGNVGREVAEDLAQDVFLSAWKAAPAYRPRARSLSWLLRIAKNACLNCRRGQRLRRTSPLDGADLTDRSGPQSESAEARAAAREEAVDVRRAVTELPAKQRAAVILRHFHDMTYADVADVLETSVPAVESLLFRARKRLRGRLTAEKKAPESPQVLPALGAESL